MRLDLSDRFLKTIKTETTTAFFDAKVPGLHIIVSPFGDEKLVAHLHGAGQ